MRQLLADKVSDNLVGLWLLVPEHLRLGTWDLLRSWAQAPAEQVEPRLALQLVHEAALCHTGIRRHRALSQRGFELLNGLPFLATDRAIHELLAQAVVSQLRQRLGDPPAHWDAAHLARAIFEGLEGDVRVSGDTIRVTYYNAPHADRLRDGYENLPAQLARENLDPRIPWLYNFKLDFRFR